MQGSGRLSNKLCVNMIVLADGEAEDELTNQQRLKFFKLTLLANSTSASLSTSTINVNRWAKD